jgi:hypothetical protein
MGKAKFKLSTHRLEQLLGLPYTARITDVIQIDSEYCPKDIIIYVEHTDFPENSEAIEIFPVWNDVTRKEFMGWGILTTSEGTDNKYHSIMQFVWVDGEEKLTLDKCTHAVYNINS